MFSLVLLCMVSFLLLTYMLVDQSKLTSFLAVVVCMGLFLGMIMMPWRVGLSQRVERLAIYLPTFFASMLRWVVATRNSLSQQKSSMILALLGTGLLIHLLAISQVFVVGRVLDGESIQLLSCLAVVPPALFVSYLPFSIAGWGVREASMVIAFGLIGVKPALAILISLSIGMAILFISLLGCLLWLFAGFRSAYKRASN
jgi:hypothetical protein